MDTGPSFLNVRYRTKLNLNEVTTLARELMDQHGLKRWGLKLINAKTKAGSCRTVLWDLNPEHSRGIISLSREFMTAFDEKHVRNTILHEIAHALVDPSEAAHGSVWKRTAIRIGCTGERCVSPDAPKIKGRYKIVCPNGHEDVRHRLTDTIKNSSCSRCSKSFDSRYMFNIYDNGHLIHSRKSLTPKPTEPAAPARPMTATELSTNHSEYLKKFLRGY